MATTNDTVRLPRDLESATQLIGVAPKLVERAAVRLGAASGFGFTPQGATALSAVPAGLEAAGAADAMHKGELGPRNRKEARARSASAVGRSPGEKRTGVTLDATPARGS